MSKLQSRKNIIKRLIRIVVSVFALLTGITHTFLVLTFHDTVVFRYSLKFSLIVAILSLLLAYAMWPKKQGIQKSHKKLIDLVDDEEVKSYEYVVSKDCIVNLSSDNKLRPKIALAIVPNRGRFIENPKDIIYQVFNAELPIALIGSRVGESVKFRNTTYTIESISYYNLGKSSTSNNVVY